MADSGKRDEQLQRLLEENEELRARNAELEEERDVGVASESGRWRWPFASLLLVIGGLLLALAVPAVWASRTLLNTERYTETVAPLAEDPAIQSAVAASAVDGLFERADVEAQIRENLPPEAAFTAPAIASGLHDFSQQAAERLLASPQFETLWTEANRGAHERIVGALLTGEGGRSGAVDIESGTVSMDISQIVAQVKQALVERGIGIVENVPDDVAGGNVTLFESAALGQVQDALRALQSLAVALPIVMLLVLGAAVFVAPDRRKALLWVGVTAIVAMLVVGVGLAMLRNAYVSSPPLGILSGTAAVSFFDTIFRFLRNAVRTVAVLGLVLLIGTALAGPSPIAVRLRQAVSGGLSDVGVDLGPASLWFERHRRALDVTLVIMAAAVLLATNTPTPGLVIGLAVVVLLGMLIVEFLAHAHPSQSQYQQHSLT